MLNIHQVQGNSRNLPNNSCVCQCEYIGMYMSVVCSWVHASVCVCPYTYVMSCAMKQFHALPLHESTMGRAISNHGVVQTHKHTTQTHLCETAHVLHKHTRTTHCCDPTAFMCTLYIYYCSHRVL